MKNNVTYHFKQIQFGLCDSNMAVEPAIMVLLDCGENRIKH